MSQNSPDPTSFEFEIPESNGRSLVVNIGHGDGVAGNSEAVKELSRESHDKVGICIRYYTGLFFSAIMFRFNYLKWALNSFNVPSIASWTRRTCICL